MKKGPMKYLALTAMFGCAFTANAGVVYYTIGGTADLQTFNVDFGGSAYNVYAGGIQVSQPDTASDPNNSGMPQSYVSVCTDFKGSLYIGSTYAYNAPANGFAGQLGIDPTWNNPTLAIQNAAYLFYNYGGNPTASTGITGSVEQMAALQLAVWIALYDTTSTGTVNMTAASEFYVNTSSNSGNDTAAITLALSYLNGLNGGYDYTGNLLTPVSSLGDQGNPDGQLPQELLMGGGQPQGGPIPEPSTILAGAMLLLPCGLSVVRIFRKSREASTS